MGALPVLCVPHCAQVAEAEAVIEGGVEGGTRLTVLQLQRKILDKIRKPPPPPRSRSRSSPTAASAEAATAGAAGAAAPGGPQEAADAPPDHSDSDSDVDAEEAPKADPPLPSSAPQLPEPAQPLSDPSRRPEAKVRITIDNSRLVFIIPDPTGAHHDGGGGAQLTEVLLSVLRGCLVILSTRSVFRVLGLRDNMHNSVDVRCKNLPPTPPHLHEGVGPAPPSSPYPLTCMKGLVRPPPPPHTLLPA